LFRAKLLTLRNLGLLITTVSLGFRAIQVEYFTYTVPEISRVFIWECFVVFN
jgi:hypothetical protein